MTIKENWPYYVANKPCEPNHDLEVTDKFTGDVAARVALADTKAIEDGIAGCVAAAEPFAQMPPYERQQVLNHCVTRFTCLLYTSPSPRDQRGSRMPSSA